MRRPSNNCYLRISFPRFVIIQHFATSICARALSMRFICKSIGFVNNKTPGCKHSARFLCKNYTESHYFRALISLKQNLNKFLRLLKTIGSAAIFLRWYSSFRLLFWIGESQNDFGHPIFDL